MTTPDAETWQCRHCGKTFTVKRKWSGHVSSHSRPGLNRSHIEHTAPVVFRAPPPVEESKCARVPLTRGAVAIVDAEDLDKVSVHKWSLHWPKGDRTGYAVTNSPAGQIRMHRLIMDAPRGITVDHISGDGLDNRRANLRLASQANNSANQRRKSTNSSGYKGVYFSTRRQRWVAEIRPRGKHLYLGLYDSAEAAHEAYKAAAAKYFGEYARSG